MAKKSKQQTWYERVFDTLDFSQVARDAGLLDIETGPAWVLNVARELVQQAMPAVNIRTPKGITAREVGRAAGQICANVYALGETMSPASEAFKKVQAFAAISGQYRRVPVVQSARKSMLQGYDLLAVVAAIAQRIETTVIKAFKAALDQDSRVEAAEFFRGFAEGICKPGMTAEPSLVGATTATPIYGRLLVHHTEIEQLKSVRDLRAFLLVRGLSEQVLGDPKRLEKLCERIGLSFRKRGRPKRAK